ncbi:hypothetical protein B0T18DRAFT_315714 [Schizothecium vesticola]|uniref:Uncharacterized protein n=1 Tax=Schizothecium vesticola TaxID=314040 RepID=A0AA40F8J1_9PEZI|nr:hypothetical protein B0T18DRAFT_315714 [Schizothecium vesticola]
MATNGTAHEEHPTSSQSSEIGGNKASSGELSKEEVGWYFVEQYYKTLNKSPEKLHLFYSKNSQYLVGKDAELTQVSIGRAAIQERISKLDLDNCKVRISNVDTQACDDKILIQTIGHTANKEGEPKKFVQTFVLAQQPSGYFVLNDIMRYMPDQDWESEETAPTAEEAAAPADQEAEPAAEPEAAVAVPKKPEPVEPEAVAEEAVQEPAPEPEAAAPAAEAPAAEAAPEAEEPAAEEKAEPTPEPEAAAQEPAAEEAKKVEEPKETPAAPVAAPQAPAAAEPEKPRQPPKPMTWASRLAASGPVRPAVPVSMPKTATSSAAPQPRQPAPAAAPAAAQPTPAAQSTEAAPAQAAAKDQGSEWQTAETRRQNKAQAAAAAPPKKEDNMAYIKFVTDKVQEEDLKTFLAGFGELEYFDINRQKNCAFVEFKTKAGYNAALNASPHTINGENISIEPRRPKANAYGGSNYSNPRGGAAPRGRGGFESGRTGSLGAGRGGSFGQSRGRGGAPRGRGAAQAGAA